MVSTLTVAVPSEADPYVVILGVIEVPDELHLRSAVERQQVCIGGLAVMQGVRPGETLLLVVHKVTVAAIWYPVGQTLPITRGRGRRRFLCEEI